ncbi:MAG: hypothetical protein H6622_01450 [Halobacteriovoraceae bacterium]|nr:hypothetical protein [Halobacteriovoraceae bacterium]
MRILFFIMIFTLAKFGLTQDETPVLMDDELDKISVSEDKEENTKLNMQSTNENALEKIVDESAVLSSDEQNELDSFLEEAKSSEGDFIKGDKELLLGENEKDISELLDSKELNHREALKKNYKIETEILDENTVLKKRKMRTIRKGFEKFRAIVKKRSILVDLETGEPRKILKDIITYVKHVDLYSGRFYILDKDGTSRYITHVDNIYRANEITKIFPEVQDLSNYTSRQRYQDLNKTEVDRFTVSNKLALFLNTTQSTFYSNYFDIDESRAAGIKLEYRGYYKWNFPLVYGALINVSRSYVIESLKSTKLSWDTINFGPVIRFPYYENDTAIFFLELNAQKSIYGNANYEESYSISEISFGIDFDFSFPITKFNTDQLINLGIGARLSKTSVNDGPVAYTYPANSTQNFEISLYVGFMNDIVF